MATSGPEVLPPSERAQEGNQEAGLVTSRPEENESKQRKPKRPKPAPTNDPALWPRCKFWMMRKGRFCNMEPCPGANFCGVHVAEVGDGEPPKPPSSAPQGESGKKGAGHGALGSKDRVLAATDAAAPADPEHSATVATVEANQDTDGLGEDMEPAQTGEAEAGSRKRKARSWRERGGRVPCPHDPSHTVYERELAKHMLSCPVYLRQLEMEGQPFFKRGVNLCGDDPRKKQTVTLGAAVVAEEEREEEELRSGIVNPKLESMLQTALAGGKDLVALAARIGEVYSEVVGSIRTEVLCPDSCKSLLEGKVLLSGESVKHKRKATGEGDATHIGAKKAEPEGDVEGDASGSVEGDASGSAEIDRQDDNVPFAAVPGFRQLRHVEQQASIVGHMEARGLLDDALTYVEMGAGRGMLSLTLRSAAPRAKLVFIERSGCRNKADRQLRGLESEGKFTRIRMDIAHLDMWGVDVVRDDRGEGATRSAAAKEEGKVQGVAIATCCHHRCNALSYINRPFIRKVLERCGLGGGQEQSGMEGFALIQLMTSWACCSDVPSMTVLTPPALHTARRGGGAAAAADGGLTVASGCGAAAGRAHGKGSEAAQALSREQKETVGRQCKRLLDMGRVEWLREQGLQAELVHFCAKQTSPENCLVLAWR